LELKVIREIPENLKPKAVENAVREFIVETMPDVDPIGLFNQTIERIAMATFLMTPGWEFWMAEDKGEVKMYALANVTKDLDNRLCYWINQLWLAPEERHDNGIRERTWAQLKGQAIRRHCAHIVMASIRDGWSRFLGDDVQPYLTLLKKDLEE